MQKSLLTNTNDCMSICEAYFKKYPARIGFLRVDTLSLLLSMANIAAHSDVLVVDMVGGLLTGAVAERLGGLLFCFFIRAL
ncbi:hypothetical protein CK203_019859 [Vitis vinifera]|uniref:tRNA (adenine(58)-N(1))-methyltransferase non-catalytic subunit TRM6 n=1 Tax=Vitis vinifera TaxID=29760 RepID=A0A438J2V1_VITVI|nr:hypothetical protein CK203_019859 [Vitis vinifera]